MCPTNPDEREPNPGPLDYRDAGLRLVQAQAALRAAHPDAPPLDPRLTWPLEWEPSLDMPNPQAARGRLEVAQLQLRTLHPDAPPVVPTARWNPDWV